MHAAQISDLRSEASNPVPLRRLAERFLILAVLVFSPFATVPRLNAACPFCPPQTPTLSERFSQSDVALLAGWVSTDEGKDESGATTRFEIVEVARSHGVKYQRGDRIVVGGRFPGSKGDLFLLTAQVEAGVAWDTPEEISETAYQYIKQSPSRELDPVRRLGYYIRFLEFPDSLIAEDAFAEFAKAPYEDVAALRGRYSREKLRQWVFEAKALPIRTGLYGMMLGLCGDDSDARRMQELIQLDTRDFRLGIDGIMGGFLLLRGETGLDFVDEHRLRNREVAFNETYAAMQALRFMWSYGEGRISRERLRKSLRILLDRPKLAEIVITDLARWEDWQCQDRLMQLYDQKAYSSRFVRRAIAGFLLVCLQSEPDQPDAVQKQLYQRTRSHLADLRDRDPDIVKQAERLVRMQGASE